MDYTLVHYGVIGMKWGVRKDPDKAYGKAAKKLRKLDTKLVKQNRKMNKAYEKSNKAGAKATTDKKIAKAEKAANKYYKQAWKSEKARTKAYKWANKMSEYFDGIELNNVDPDDVALGQAYMQILFEDARRGHG